MRATKMVLTTKIGGGIILQHYLGVVGVVALDTASMVARADGCC